ncbi:MAG: 30S ribosomal protein S1 [Nitrospirae bacterium GWC2_57_13]|nr:MAG: 30S ribosomal protein S1 [Nitrospirae bacterium GWC2_57_13]
MIDKEQDFEYEGEERTGEQGQNEFENLYNQSLKSFKQGSVVKGTIAQVLAGSVMVDVGYKSDGMIPVDQFTADELASLQPGDEIEVFLESGEDSHGNLRLSREKAKRMQAWDHLNNAYQSGSPIKSKVLAKVKGGLSVDIGVSAFLPGSQIDMRPLRNLDQYLGKVLDVKIIKMNPGRGNIVVSRRAILEQQSASQKEETLAKLADGQTVKGIVKNITDYGAFIDLGGIDGLLHITDMSWGRIGHPSDLLSTGQSIDVVVLKFDTERQKVSLGLKQQTEDPWLRVADRFPVNGRVRGKVVNLAEYGAFIELEPGVEGLVHVSEMSWTQKVKHPSRVVSLDDEIEVQVLSVDPSAKRISLGMKQVEPNPWQTIADRYPAGTVVEGKIKTITDFGAFVGIEEGIDGLIHVSDLSWTRHIKHPSELLKKGQTVKSMVLNIDAQKERISLGLKQLDADPWDKGIPERYAMGRDETVKVVKAAEFGLFVGLEFGIEGLIPASEIPRESEGIKEGDEVTARVIKVDRGERKVALSIKALVKGKDRESVKDYLGQQDKFDTTIGALLKGRN